MKVINSLKFLPNIALFAICLVLPVMLLAQCPTDVNYGQNTVINGDFSQGYTGWSYTPQVTGWTGDPPAPQADGYRKIPAAPSLPGDILVGTNPNAQFNSGFQTFGDHTSGTGNFLMVDGVCKLGVTMFSQTVTVVANTNYYFSIWVNSLKDNPTNPGILNFDVNGVNLGTITCPALGGGSVGGAWKKYEIIWNSGLITGSLPISIKNLNTASCSNQVDIAIDDIAFIPGCSYGAPGPQPDLGPDQTLCGKGGSITLNANVPQLPTTKVSWSDGTSNTGSNPAFYTKVISVPGTYSVCVTDNGSCVKSDVIVISNTFSINIGGPYSFCSSASQILDAGFTGIGTTYKWYKGGILVPYPNDTKTYTATSAGTYKVDVTVLGCGTQSSTTTITTTAPVAPVDAYFCATSGPVSGVTLSATNLNSANLSWFTAATGGTAIVPGVTTPNGTTSQYAVPTIPMGTTATKTYYVQDNTIATGSVGPTAFSSVNNSAIPTTTNYLQFQPGGDFTINSLQIPFIFYNPFGQFTVTLEVTDASGASFTPAKTFTSGLSVQTPVNDGTTRLFTLPFTGFNISKSWGSTLGLKLISTSFTYQGQIMIGTNGGSYPYNSSVAIPNVVTIPNSIVGGAVNTTGYSFFYNWNVTAKSVCSRTPVRAISNCPTPVTWTSFYLVPQDNNSCKLVWSTADETNNSYFAIERSVNGVTFETIETISGAGNRDIASNYFYLDNTPLSGTSYYRITQHDYDGKFSSTSMKPYSSLGLIQVTTFPNPFQNNTSLLVSGAYAEAYTYALYSLSGQLVEQGLGTINQIITIGEKQAKGMYMLTVLTSTDIIKSKIVKQ